jgi:hypothetical protein
MDSDLMSSMYAQIVSGTAKEDSHLVTDAETSQAWDIVAKQVGNMREKNPNVHFEIPHEIPGRPGTPVNDGAPLPGTSGSATARFDRTRPTERPAVQPPSQADGRFFAIQDVGDPSPWALVRIVTPGIYERWTGPTEEWVDMPFFAAYFVGGEIGATEIDPAHAEALKARVKPMRPGAISMQRGDGKRAGSG